MNSTDQAATAGAIAAVDENTLQSPDALSPGDATSPSPPDLSAGDGSLSEGAAAGLTGAAGIAGVGAAAILASAASSGYLAGSSGVAAASPTNNKQVQSLTAPIGAAAEIPASVADYRNALNSFPSPASSAAPVLLLPSPEEPAVSAFKRKTDAVAANPIEPAIAAPAAVPNALGTGAQKSAAPGPIQAASGNQSWPFDPPAVDAPGSPVLPASPGGSQAAATPPAFQQALFNSAALPEAASIGSADGLSLSWPLDAQPASAAAEAAVDRYQLPPGLSILGGLPLLHS